MSKLPSVKHTAYLVALCASAALLPACNTVSTQSMPEADLSQAQAELNAHADNAFAELDGKAKPHSSNPQLNNAAPQQTSPVKNQYQEPSWVLTPPTSADYIYGVGSAGINSTEATAGQIADDQAKVNLAAKLRISVSAVNNAHDQLKDGKVSQTFSSAIRNTVKATSYSGLRIIERYIAKNDNTVYSLAALHRQTALDNVQQQITLIDQQLMAAQTAGHNGSPIQRLRKALPSLQHFEQRQLLNQQALDLSGAKISIPLSPELLQYQSTIDTLIEQLHFRVAQQGEPILRDNLIKSLTDQGMRVSQQNNADIVINYRVSWRHIAKDSQHYQLANATVSLLDQQGKTLSTYIEKAKGISGDAGLAKDKALEKLALQLSHSLGTNLLDAIK